MEYIHACIEQLHLAAEQLQRNLPAYGRFSLILTDNIVELMMHRRCKELIKDREWLADDDNEPFSDSVKQRVLGHHFEEKVKFLTLNEYLSERERDFILSAHDYRNVLYHVGIRHEEFIGDLAYAYHELACDLFARYQPASLVGPVHPSRISQIVRDVCGAEGFRMTGDTESDLQRIAHTLAQCRPEARRTLGQALSASGERDIFRLRDYRSFLIKDNIYGLSETALIEEVELHHRLFQQWIPELSQAKPGTAFGDLSARVEVFRTSWKPKFQVDPTEQWLRQLRAIQLEKCNLSALIKYDALRKRMADYEGIINGATEYLDGYIQHQIDLARGK